MRIPRQSAPFIFVLLCAFSLALWWQPVVSIVNLALGNPAYTHILLIVPLSMALILMRWNTFERDLRPSLAAGSVLLAMSLLATTLVNRGVLNLPDEWGLSLNILALVAWWIASFLLCFGVSAVRSCLFPLCFLLGTVPVPASVLDRLLPSLQNGSAACAEALFHFARITVIRDGTLLQIPGLDIEVAQECSSIRSSLILIVTTMFLAQLFLRSWWRKALVIAAAIPLAVIKNGLRIFVITELATRLDPSFLDGNLHRHGGIIFLGIAQAVIAALIWIFYREEAVQANRARFFGQ